MTDERASGRVRRLLQLLAEGVERALAGDPRAFDGLAEALEGPTWRPEDLEVVALVLRSLAGAGWGAAAADPDLLSSDDRPPGAQAERVPSAEERAALSPEALGYLFDLRRRGALDPGQFERVVDLLAGSGARPVGLAVAREVASRVALRLDPEDGLEEHLHGDLAH